MAVTQSYQNHGRFDPPMHFFVFPVLLINLGVAIYIAIHFRHDYPYLGHWSIIVSLALLVLAFKCRVNDLRLQDRIIRLEETLRLQSLLPDDLRSRINELRMSQLIGLRFCSDAELPDVTRAVLAGEVKSQDEIKKRVTQWRADHHRI